MQIRKKNKLTEGFKPHIQPKTSLLQKFSPQLTNQFHTVLKNKTFLHFPWYLHDENMEKKTQLRMSGCPANFTGFYDISRKASGYNIIVLKPFQGVMCICWSHYSDPFHPVSRKLVQKYLLEHLI